MLLLLLSRFSRAQLCATPETAAHQAPPSLGFSRQEHWTGLPFPSPMHENEKWKGSRSVTSDSATPWTAAYQAPPSMGFSRQEYWSGVPFKRYDSGHDILNINFTQSQISYISDKTEKRRSKCSFLFHLSLVNWVLSLSACFFSIAFSDYMIYFASLLIVYLYLTWE